MLYSGIHGKMFYNSVVDLDAVSRNRLMGGKNNKIEKLNKN